MSKAALCATSTVSRAKAWNTGSTSRIVGCPASASGRMPWITAEARVERAPRIDQLLEALLAQQPAVDDAHRADLDDLVALGRIEARGLGVEHGVAQLGERAIVECARLRRGLEQVEVVELGAPVLARGRRGLDADPRRPNTAAESGRTPRAGPARARTRIRRRGARRHRAASAASRPRRCASAPSASSSRSRCSSPGRSRPGRAGPAFRRPASAVAPNARHARRPAGRRGRRAPAAASSCRPSARGSDRPRRRSPAPNRGLRCAARRPRPGRRRACPPSASASSARSARSPARDCRRAVIAATSSRTTAWKRSRIGASRSGSSSISTAACRLPSEARLPSVRPSSRRSRRASCSKSRVMSSSIRTKPLRPAFDFALARRVVHRRHLHAQQLAGRRAGDELRRRAGRAIAHALADALERVGDQRPVEDGVDRAAEADQLGAAGRRRACSTRRGTGPGRGCCRAGSRPRGCTPRRSGSARPSAPTGGCARPRCRGWPGRPAVRRPAAAARAGAAGH